MPSVEPSSTKISSSSPGGIDWPSSELMQSSMWAPGLKTGTMTLTEGVASDIEPRMLRH